jgi:hypothetical protein
VFEPLEADLPKAAQHLLLSVNLLSAALTQPQAAVARETVLTGEFPVRRQLTEELSLEIFFADVR